MREHHSCDKSGLGRSESVFDVGVEIAQIPEANGGMRYSNDCSMRRQAKSIEKFAPNPIFHQTNLRAASAMTQASINR